MKTLTVTLVDQDLNKNTLSDEDRPRNHNTCNIDTIITNWFPNYIGDSNLTIDGATVSVGKFNKIATVTSVAMLGTW